MTVGYLAGNAFGMYDYWMSLVEYISRYWELTLRNVNEQKVWSLSISRGGNKALCATRIFIDPRELE